MKRPISRLWLVGLFVAANLTMATRAAAQSPGATAAGSAWSVHDARWPLVSRDYPPPDRFAGDVSKYAVGQQRTRSRDSLRNGALLGTVIGAAALGAFAAILCNAYQEEGDPSCLGDTVRFAVIGGAIGAGAGLVIDAARHQRTVTWRFAIRF